MTELSFMLLRLLADGEFHSGEALARALAVSRATVWNAVRSLEAAELEIYKVRGRGYKLAEPVSLLSMERITRSAGTSASRLSIELVDAVGSTNTLLMQRGAAGAPGGTVVAAEHQQEGRGRLGRQWHASLGCSLTFSILWRFTQGASELAGLSLAAGVALVRALERAGAHEVRLKWPNDVLWRGQKLAGMLIEMQGDALGPSVVVVGVGVNVRLSSALRGRIDQPSADLESACGRAVDRSAVLGLLLAELVQVLDVFSQRGFAGLRAEWERYHAHQGQPIAVKLPGGGTQYGIARGVADDGALLFESGDTVRKLHSGDISVRDANSDATARKRARTSA